MLIIVKFYGYVNKVYELLKCWAMSSYVWYVGLFALFQIIGVLFPLFFRPARKVKSITDKMLSTYISV